MTTNNLEEKDVKEKTIVLEVGSRSSHRCRLQAQFRQKTLSGWSEFDVLHKSKEIQAARYQ